MAVHKVPLDVEADDKFLGPLSFKQFLFGGGALVFGYFTFWTATSGLWPLSIIFIFPTLIGAIFAFPWSKEQPSELFLASRIRFYIKPRLRKWDQSGMKHLVEVTVPKQLVHNMTDGLNQTEVRSRFNALATMVDSRGWAVKNSTMSAATAVPASDRLINPDTSIPTDRQAVLQSTPDIMDENSSTIARQFDNMIQKSAIAQKSATMDIIAKARQHNEAPDPAASTADANQNFWFTDQTATTVQPTNQTTAALPVQSGDPLLSDDELLAKVHEKQRRDALQTGTHHGTTINPDGSIIQSGSPLPATDNTKSVVDDTTAISQNTADQAAPAQPQQTPQPPEQSPVSDPVQPPVYPAQDNPQHAQYQVPEVSVTNKRNPDILELAQSNDLNIETLARQSHKNDDGEVVISLH
jgi:hypothetical protein